MGGLGNFLLLSPKPPSPMPSAQELKRVQEELDTQITAVEQEEQCGFTFVIKPHIKEYFLSILF